MTDTKKKAKPRGRATKKAKSVDVEAVQIDIDLQADKPFAGNPIKDDELDTSQGYIRTGDRQLELDELERLKAELASKEAELKTLKKEPAIRKNFYIPAELCRSLEAFAKDSGRTQADIVCAGIQLEMKKGN